MAVSLADSVFLSISPTDARPKVLLFLLFSFAPFTVVARFVGPIVQRFAGGQRAVLFVVLVNLGATRAFAQFATLFVVTALRFLSVRFNWATREPKDLSDRVWRLWGRKDSPTDPLDPVTGRVDRID